jgi:hypothetical protein
MQRNESFPFEDFLSSLEETTLAAFHRHHPTVLEVLSTSDACWMNLPAISSTRLAQSQSLTERICSDLRPSAVIKIMSEELLPQHLQLILRQDLLQRHRHELRENGRRTRLNSG